MAARATPAGRLLKHVGDRVGRLPLWRAEPAQVQLRPPLAVARWRQSRKASALACGAAQVQLRPAACRSTMSCHHPGWANNLEGCGGGSCVIDSVESVRCVCDPGWAYHFVLKPEATPPRCTISLPLIRVEICVTTVLTVVVAALVLRLLRSGRLDRWRGGVSLLGLVTNLSLLTADLIRWGPVRNRGEWVAREAAHHFAVFCCCTVYLTLTLDQFCYQTHAAAELLLQGETGSDTRRASWSVWAMGRDTALVLLAELCILAAFLSAWTVADWDGAIFFALEAVYDWVFPLALVWLGNVKLRLLDRNLAIAAVQVVGRDEAELGVRALQGMVAAAYKRFVLSIAMLIGAWFALSIIMLSNQGYVIIEHIDELWFVPWVLFYAYAITGLHGTRCSPLCGAGARVAVAPPAPAKYLLAG